MDLRIDTPLALLLLLPLFAYFAWTYWRERQRLKKKPSRCTWYSGYGNKHFSLCSRSTIYFVTN